MVDVEKLAGAQHEIWSHWMRYMYSRMAVLTVNPESDEVTIGMKQSDYLRWQQQMATRYSDLTESERESDRDIVRDFLLSEHLSLVNQRPISGLYACPVCDPAPPAMMKDV